MDSIKRCVPSGPVNANAGYNKGTTTTAANEPTALANEAFRIFYHETPLVANFITIKLPKWPNFDP